MLHGNKPGQTDLISIFDEIKHMVGKDKLC